MREQNQPIHEYSASSSLVVYCGRGRTQACGEIGNTGCKELGRGGSILLLRDFRDHEVSHPGWETFQPPAAHRHPGVSASPASCCGAGTLSTGDTATDAWCTRARMVHTSACAGERMRASRGAPRSHRGPKAPPFWRVPVDLVATRVRLSTPRRETEPRQSAAHPHTRVSLCPRRDKAVGGLESPECVGRPARRAAVTPRGRAPPASTAV